MNERILKLLRDAVAADPNDTELRLDLAEALVTAGNHVEALTHVSATLSLDATNTRALALFPSIAQSLAAGGGTSPVQVAPVAPVQPTEPAPAPPAASPSVPVQPTESAPTPATATPASSEAVDGFDWATAESDIGVDIPPAFTISGDSDTEGVAPIEPEQDVVTLADVGGLDNVKKRLNESFLEPMKNAEIAKAFGKTLRGGLLLYGPPGCGKTFIARAVAGELGARFMSVVMTDILDAHIGQTEKNLKAVFDEARSETPTVLFLDEIDALGMKRTSLSGSAAWLRQMVNQLLIELDSMAGNNDGLYVLAATNYPWDLDEALQRPGRLDRTILVTPPDAPAREAILHYHLKNRPLAGIDLRKLSAATEDFSGADLQHLAVTAAEKAMMQSISAGEVLPIDMSHMEMALTEIKPSATSWLHSSVNVVRFANAGGRYDDLAHYLKSKKIR
ncbi:AAA family ATPase [Jonesia quinghaiensis]|uniref:AAA family ATPase n=1 Tax=Jonesia quinghaiensis TaxID=262806 RepID=UPI0003F8413E|nr:AAA family ATPase [Jonesia quinghaiensis]